METNLPHSPSLPHPASQLGNSRQPPKPNYLPNTTLLKCTDRNCRPAWHRFQPQGGKEYTVHSIQYTVQTFSWLLLSFAAESSARGPQSGKAPYHSLTLPHLFYLYISAWISVYERFLGQLLQDVHVYSRSCLQGPPFQS
jgi:hypothetical protein